MSTSSRPIEKRSLTSLAEVREYFAHDARPLYFISASNFNMMDMHRWVRGWQNINLLDCFDGNHPQVLVVPDNHAQVFQSIEEINGYLLASVSAGQLLDADRIAKKPAGRVLFLFFDESLEQMCQARGLDLILPPINLVREIDSKIVTTQIGNESGVASVPNVLARVSSWKELRELADKAGLGERLVVQSAYGDSGKTTWFIENEDDYKEFGDEIEGEDAVKIMRRIRCAGTAIEACATRWGTFVGPLLTELIGIEELTPYAGGWCGNELYDKAFTPELRCKVMEMAQAMGDGLYKRGYRGYFELDFLIDLDSHDVYLGELNARITGISAMTNMSDFAEESIPLFLFHLLEYDPDVDLLLDARAFNELVLAKGAQGTAAQVVLKYTDEQLNIIMQTPVSGIYVMDEAGDLSLKKASYSRREALAENEAFILRIATTGEYAYKGGDLAIMFVNQIIRTDKGKLNKNGTRWVKALKQTFRFRRLNQQERSLVEAYQHPANGKGGRE